MRVNKYQDKALPENYLDIHYNQMDAEVKGILEYCEAFQAIIGRKDNEQKRITPSEIYYCEIVDRKCYVYLKAEVYQIDYSIQRLLDLFGANGLVQISKSMVINIYKIDHLKTDLNMRVHINLDNGERVVLNRTFKKPFFDYLYQIKKRGEKA